MSQERKLKIQISFEDTDGSISEETVELLMSKIEFENLDLCEQQLLSGSYSAMRSALSKHLSVQSKKKAQ